MLISMGNLFINEFLQYIINQKKYSENTYLAYKNDLEEFSNFLNQTYKIYTPTEVSNEIIRTWISNLLLGKIEAVSVKRKVSTLKTYFKYLKKNEIINKNPSSNIAKLKTPKKLPPILNPETIDKIIDNKPFNNYNKILEYMVVCMLFGTGIRRNELINILESNVDTNSRLIKVLGKRNKERIIPIPIELAEQIEEFRNLKKQLNLNTEYLFVSKKGKKLNPTYIYKVVKNKLTQYNVNGRKSPHILRHAYATELLKNGASLLSVKELLGHSSLASTQVYTHVNIEDLKNIYIKNHPKQ
ncbi:MAG: tyrosine-type recombinase/integrase [Bacteroidetes bacterium]|nr:tyrosine-type recombinase/integrase [Bacteroidota bacterium]